jgi:hypothetical protein
MEESRQLRRAELAEGIKRQRELLHILKITKDSVPFSVRERHARCIQEIEDELQRMEGEFHELNVQQIREKAGSAAFGF